MSSPNVFCQVYYLENEKSLAKNKIREEKYGKKRKFYSCNNRNNYVDYVQSGSKRGLDYVEYSGDNEKSTGWREMDGAWYYFDGSGAKSA